MAWREQLAALPSPPQVCVTEVPLLYEVGAETRFDKVVVITAPTKLREARPAVVRTTGEARLLPDPREGDARRFHVRQHRHARCSSTRGWQRL